MPADPEPSTTPQSYDAIPYDIHSFSKSHPDHLFVCALTNGLDDAAASDRCRVLELGCAVGGNLIPMADALPQSTFVGVDFSTHQIEIAQRTVDQLGLTNIQFRANNILELGPDLGQFDYIIAHGVYSWVDSQVREKLLDIVHQCLADRGVAYISYNTLPGWSLPLTLRDAMWFHARDASTPIEQLAKAREILALMSDGVDSDNPGHTQAIKREIEEILHQRDSYIAHEQLETVNEPCYFHEFMDHASRHELQFLGEAVPSNMIGNRLRPEIRKRLQGWGDLILRQQYIDFLENRRFRMTLLCHGRHVLQRRISPQIFQNLYVASPCRPTTDGAFAGPQGTEIRSANPLANLLLRTLSQVYPSRLLLEELFAACTDSTEAAADPKQLFPLLWELYLRDAIQLFPRQIDFVTVPSQRPTARKLARQQATLSNRVTTLLHHTIDLQPLSRQLLVLLDGTRDVHHLATELNLTDSDEELASELKKLASQGFLIA